MKTLIMLTFSLGLASCMHLGMMGTHGGDHSEEHQPGAEIALEKEITAGDIKATASFPSLLVGKEALLTLKLTNMRNGQPISGAQVSFHATYLHKAESVARHDIHGTHGTMDSAHTRFATDHDVSFEREIHENSQPGSYAVAFTASQSGNHTLMFHVTAIADVKLEPELIIEATRDVASGIPSHGGMMHGMGSASEYLILGGALMGAMMIVMWATRGGIF